MRLLRQIVFAVLIVIGIGLLIAMDIADRDIVYSRAITEEELRDFHFYKTIDEVREAYARNYNNPEYSFPRGKVEKVKIYKNQFLTSRITSRTLSDENAKSTIEFLNNPENFDWGETTWSLKESEFIMRFFDKQDNEIGTVWFCVEGCGMTESIPFCPSMKFGGLSDIGRENLDRVLKRIDEN